MKIIHSLWTKPLEKPYKNLGLGGWRHSKYFYMSWALSCLTLNKIYGHIELITDHHGCDILINKLKLPYSSVNLHLDCLKGYNERLWALGKLHAYSIQKEPFIHVDGDVYLWQSFGDVVENAGLTAQQLDLDIGHYSYALSEIKENSFYLPEFMWEDSLKHSRIRSSNAGVIGGNDIEFIKKYCSIAFDIIEKNMSKYNLTFKGSSYAIIYEQYLFSCLARKDNKEITYYLDYDINNTEGSTNQDISSFMNKYNLHKKYVHILSYKKQNMQYCYDLENQLRMEFPEYHDRIEALYNNKKLV